jgi:hypothetical protein
MVNHLLTTDRIYEYHGAKLVNVVGKRDSCTEGKYWAERESSFPGYQVTAWIRSSVLLANASWKCWGWG